MPFSPADLEWWQWWLCALGCWVLTWWIITLVRDRRGSSSSVIGYVGGIAGGICACMGITGFVNWAAEFLHWALK
jgi:hypothetical protein